MALQTECLAPWAVHRHSRGYRHRAVILSAFPSIRDFIANECPVKGIDGCWREPAQLPTLVASAIGQKASNLVVPGERRLVYVSNEQLDRVVQDAGQVVLCCFGEDSSSRRVAAPKRGSWACLAQVAGLQRLGDRALIRVIVADRVAVQALDGSSPAITRCQAALLRDRWCYFVRTAAIEQHLAPAGRNNGAAGGPEVVTAVQQVQDAAAELLGVLQQLADAVQSAVDSPSSMPLQQQLVRCEALDELQDLLAWCQLESPLDRQQSTQECSGDSSSSTETNSIGVLPEQQPKGTSNLCAGPLLLESAWRLSFAPYALKGLAEALNSSSSSTEPSESCREALEMTDLGLRLEAGLEVAQQTRSTLAAQLALGQL